MKSEDIGKINEILGRIDAKVSKTISSRTECDTTAIGNRDRLSQHDLENKLQRRKQEAEELDKILNDITFDNNSIREKISNEVASC